METAIKVEGLANASKRRAPRLAGQSHFIPLAKRYIKETQVRRAAQNLRLAYGIPYGIWYLECGVYRVPANGRDWHKCTSRPFLVKLVNING